jgi:hypothetical protein
MITPNAAYSHFVQNKNDGSIYISPEFRRGKVDDTLRISHPRLYLRFAGDGKLSIHASGMVVPPACRVALAPTVWRNGSVWISGTIARFRALPVSARPRRRWSSSQSTRLVPTSLLRPRDAVEVNERAYTSARILSGGAWLCNQ